MLGSMPDGTDLCSAGTTVSPVPQRSQECMGLTNLLTLTAGHLYPQLLQLANRPRYLAGGWLQTQVQLAAPAAATLAARAAATLAEEIVRHC